MWYKVKKIYVGDKQVRPRNQITQEYTLPISSGSTTNISIAKSWYKIIKAVWELSATNSYTSSYNWLYFSGIKETDSYDYWVALNTWLDWWVSGSSPYGSMFSDYWYSWDSHRWLTFPSSATSRSAWACRVTVTDGKTKVELGTTFGTRLYTNEYNQNSTENTYIKGIFNGTNQIARMHKATNPTAWLHKLIVTYESI